MEALLKSPILKFGGAQIKVKNMKGIGHLFAKIGPYVREALLKDASSQVFAVVDLVGCAPHVSGKLTPEGAREALRGQVAKEHQGGFHPHVAVHEIEAWAFADESTLVSRLGASLKSYGRPETINQVRPPSRHLEELYERVGKIYTKILELPRLFSAVDPRLIHEKCPNFKVFLDDLARAAGLSSPFA
ncbi:MAG: DUF4276 family protein [Candidatus Tectomicrobia bacterium]|nr:DUF4276 family protein [Candidatus Tectomicrobia bacterium]